MSWLAPNPQLPKVASLKEGYLLKRQRGQSSGADLRGLKFQQRYICLTQDYLDYYVDKKKGEKKGEFPVTQMKIIEKVPDSTFQKTFCFQIGDEKEVMYFKAKSENERKEWIETLRIAATLKRNVMLENYHTGAYGQVHQRRWSCCSAANRDTPGCQQTSTGSNRQPRRMTSVIESRSSSETVVRRKFTSFHGRNSKRQQQQQRSPSPIFHDAREAPEDASQQTSLSLATCPTSPLSEFEQEGRTSEALRKLMHQDSQSDSIEMTSHMLRSIRHGSHDSGLSLDLSSRFGGSLQSIISGPGMSLSPPIHRRQAMAAKLEEVVPENEPHKYKETRGCRVSTETQEKRSHTWKCWDIPQQNTPKSEVISAIFRRTDTLVAAHKDGSVKVFDIAKPGAARLKNSYTQIGTIGSIDIWKNYLALGLPELKLVNLDNNRTLHGPTEDQGIQYPHLVAFTPRGNLLSYNQSQPNIIKTWPKVESSWSSLDVESESLLKTEDDSIDSLLVSPNPTQPWLAVSTTTTRQLQVYNYETHDLKYHLDTDYEKAVVSFAPNGQHIAVARGRSLTVYDIESSTSVFHFPELDVPITSLAYNPWPRYTHLAVGLSNGEIKVYSGLLNSTPELVVSLDQSKQASRSITSLSYSCDGLTLATGSSSGKLKLWKVHKPSKSENGGVALVREGEMTVDNKGKQYVSPDDGLVVIVPPGAIAKGKTITFKYGVVPDGPFGPFEFPDGVRPVSAILSLHPTTEEPLLKPIEIALPHFIHCETQEDQKRLAVYKADCHGEVKNGKTVYSFKQMTDVMLSLGTYCGDPNHPQGIPYAKCSIDHCCYLCYGEYGKDDTDRAIFSLFDIKPKTLDPLKDLVIRFCLAYFLPTCHKTVREQYPEEAYDMGIQSVKFSSVASVDDPAISIRFEERLGSWILSLQGGNEKKIYRQEVCFWDYPSPFYVEDMCRNKLYPPHFDIVVRGPFRPDDSMVKAVFTFPGAEVIPGRGEPVAVVALPLKAQQYLSTGHTSSGNRSRISSEQSIASEIAPVRLMTTQNHFNSPSGLQPVAQAFKACMFDLDELHPSKLAVSLFSKDLIDEAYFKSIQASVTKSAKDEMVMISVEILQKIYDSLKTDARLYTPVHEVLKKLHPDSARKFASETSRLSREGSTASNFSYSTTQERLSNELEPDANDEVFPSPISMANCNGSSTSMSQYHNDSEKSLLVFCSQMSTEPRSTETETAERTPLHAMDTN